MRKRFLVGLITCLFATFSVFPFVAISEQECKQGVCAEGRFYGSTKKRAKARVSSTASYDGRWTYRLQLGGDPAVADQQLYWKGYSETWEIEKHTATGSAYGSNHGKHRASGKIYFAKGYEASGG